jgi:hypothetical protein
MEFGMKIKAKMTGPGLVVDRSAKHGKINIAIDPSPEGFISEARRENARLKILLIPGDGTTDPIEISAIPKSLMLKCEAAAIPAGRLADVEALITEEKNVHVVLEYVPSQASLPFAVSPEATKATKLAVSGPKATEQRQEIPLKFKGLRNCKALITVTHQADGWRAGHAVQLGNYVHEEAPEDTTAADTRAMAIRGTARAAIWWAEQVEISGGGDTKRGTQKRLAEMCKQIEDQVKALTGTPEPEEFAEDEPQPDAELEDGELNADEDQDI